MSGWEHVHGLMAGIGELMDLPEVTELPDNDYWHLVWDDGTAIHVDYARETERIVLSTGLGQPRAAAREPVYDMLLVYNGAWRETGGARLALDEPGGEVMLLFDVTAVGLDVSALQGVLANLREVGALWRRLIARGSSGSGEALPFAMPMGAIRG